VSIILQREIMEISRTELMQCAFALRARCKPRTYHVQQPVFD